MVSLSISFTSEILSARSGVWTSKHLYHIALREKMLSRYLVKIWVALVMEEEPHHGFFDMWSCQILEQDS